MKETATTPNISTASVTDRGLNAKRPLNEDSLLSDPERRIFAVADGVGGAEAGEVASQTAIEVLQEAFLHHQDGEDAEDLMEIAIQRANASIYQMSHEHPKLSMMATTIVALHLQGLRATIGHVGDSRLYRLSAQGRLSRETDDHSIVEEEVRAGRMTAEQAANHPSRNVISRALGAEAAVEVDLKTVEVEPGTVFLLCSDGITRHVPDEELGGVLRGARSLEDACAELKRLCFERGAEDNLTAVAVRVGEPPHRAADARDDDEEHTIIAERPNMALHRTLSDEDEMPAYVSSGAFDGAGSPPPRPAASGPADSAGNAGAAVNVDDSRDAGGFATAGRAQPAPAAVRSGGGSGRAVTVLLLLLAASAAAFYGGMYFQRTRPAETAAGSLTPPATSPAALPTPAASADAAGSSAAADYERRRREVDRAPAPSARRMAEELRLQPDREADPEFLYLYGRALLLSGRDGEAANYFSKAVERLGANALTPEHGQLKIEARLATVAALLRSNDAGRAAEAARALDDVIMKETDAVVGAERSPAPGVSPF